MEQHYYVCMYIMSYIYIYICIYIQIDSSSKDVSKKRCASYVTDWTRKFDYVIETQLK